MIVEAEADLHRARVDFNAIVLLGRSGSVLRLDEFNGSNSTRLASRSVGKKGAANRANNFLKIFL
jgi:hypothetical protein